jgi:hypothetical protein
MYRQVFPNVIFIVQGALTTPVTSVTCERSFSKMKTITTTLRNIMGDVRLNDLSVLSVERDVEIDFDDVVEVFTVNHNNCLTMWTFLGEYILDESNHGSLMLESDRIRLSENNVSQYFYLLLIL